MIQARQQTSFLFDLDGTLVDTAEDLAAALPHLKRLCVALHIPVLELDGYEADDIIGTLSHQAETSGDFETFMVTPDKDFAQLIAAHTHMWKPGRKGSDHDVIDLARIGYYEH